MAQASLDVSDPTAATIGGHDSLYRSGLTLAELKPGECGTVKRLFGPAQGRLRLLEMGLTPGPHIRMVRAAAFGGPLDINVRGYQLSLRRDEAAGVWLDDPDDDAEGAPIATLSEALGGERSAEDL
jgi:ferrous iron transport protein A